jgi:hypothetical protein
VRSRVVDRVEAYIFNRPSGGLYFQQCEVGEARASRFQVGLCAPAWLHALAFLFRGRLATLTLVNHHSNTWRT